MIISRTPFRISFFGGGTDYPSWYKQKKGMVISSSINKYNYITLRKLPPYFKFKYRLKYHKVEEVNKINQIKHHSVRACFDYFKVNKGMELTYNADLPAQSGLGSSSSFTVGLLNALYSLNNFNLNKRKLASNAIMIEQKLLKENVGSQDQINAAYGGFNKIYFNRKNNFSVSPIIFDVNIKKKLEENLLLFFTGFQRNANSVAGKIIKNIDKRKNELEKMLNLSQDAYDILNSGSKIDEFGKLLHYQWELKKKLANNITNQKIDKIYSTGLSNGALGGKLLGAGAGGFIIFYVKKNNQKKVIKSLKNLINVPFKFEDTGSSIIYSNKDS